MVVGNLCKSDTLKEEPVNTDENKPVQQQPPPAAANETEANNTESVSVTLRVDSSHEPADMNVQGETMTNRPAMTAEENVPVTPLSNMSHLQYYSTRSRLSSASCPTGKRVIFSKINMLISFDISKQYS